MEHWPDLLIHTHDSLTQAEVQLAQKLVHQLPCLLSLMVYFSFYMYNKTNVGKVKQNIIKQPSMQFNTWLSIMNDTMGMMSQLCCWDNSVIWDLTWLKPVSVMNEFRTPAFLIQYMYISNNNYNRLGFSVYSVWELTWKYMSHQWLFKKTTVKTIFKVHLWVVPQHLSRRLVAVLATTVMELGSTVLVVCIFLKLYQEW